MRNKIAKLIAGLLLALTATGCIYGGYLYAQNKAPASGEVPNVLTDPKVVADPISADPGVRAQARQRFIERAKLLRDHWQGWAYSNREVLRRLVSAGPTDMAALQDAYDAIPTENGSAGSGSGISDADLAASGATYTWQPYASTEVGAGLNQTTPGRHPLAEGVESDFAQHRDIALCDSISTGRLHYTLWASGRVTEMTSMDKFMGHGQPILLYDSVSKEICPAYDFVGKAH